ncbi:unnamed protein product [Calicophoron daubneyi]|uniref:E3 ubiquitin-protein ligase n=1 Tax=Calicophoron daubneyi TaxID=300641 RepID=A0AAV2TEB0_CALDB
MPQIDSKHFGVRPITFFAKALLSVPTSSFEELLYEGVRLYVSNLCAPQVCRPDSVVAENTGDSDAEPNQSEYADLEKTLFRAFELYIAGDMHTSSGGGYCDCGDMEAWRAGPQCSHHRPAENQSSIGADASSIGTDPTELTSGVEVELKRELNALRKHLDNLPVDVVCRASRLLKPLINSTIFCLTDLIQGTSCITSQPLSTRGGSATGLADFVHELSSLPDVVNVSAVSPGKKTVVQTADELWLADDNVVELSADNDFALDHWPPPLSHIPLVSPLMDANSLGRESWPRTAPRNRAQTDVESRALAQLARARRLHPRLFPPRPTRTASERTAASQAFVVILYNNEFHNYEQVIKTLRRVLDCTTQQATNHAVFVNRDGRSLLQVNLSIKQAANTAAVVMRTSNSLSTRPLQCTSEHADVYSMGIFFTLFLRWLYRIADQVTSLRPLICHALLGWFYDGTETNADKPITMNLPVLPHGEILQPHSWLSSAMERHSLTWRALRLEVLHVIMVLLLRDAYYRRVFAIKFTRSYAKLMQDFIYDDHAEVDNFTALSCQIYTVISLARQLLEQHNVLVRVLSRLEAAFEANSDVLPDFYVQPPLQAHAHDAGGTDDSNGNDSERGSNTSWIQHFIEVLRRANPFEWGSSSSPAGVTGVSRLSLPLIDDPDQEMVGGPTGSNRVPPEPRVLVWQAGATLGRSQFHPFERLFDVVGDIAYVLGSLTNVRPLCGDPADPQGWWNTAGRSAFIDYIRLLLRMFGYVQDMNGMQRETRGHVEEELEWASGFFILSKFINVLGLTVQVASSDYELFKSVLSEARQAFEYRVGIMDRRFRIGPLPSSKEGNKNDTNKPSSLSFQSLGVTTEVYWYDVSTYRFSLLQPIPRLLASLYGHGLEMGLSFAELGLQDKAFVNLLIERPLQMVAFCAQYNAKMWVRNGYAVQQSVVNMFAPLMRVELIDRDLQLLQLAAAILSPDEFIVRMVHKLNLNNYLKSHAPGEPGPGRVQAVEMLLRTLLSILTNRSRPSIGRFTEDYINVSDDPTVLKSCVVDQELENTYGSLLDDVIHALCLRPMICSELLDYLPYQSSISLLHAPADNLDSESLEVTPSAASSEAVRPASVSRRANKRAVEQVLPRLLRRLATESSVGGRTVFTIRPDVIAYRFNRFHWGYRHAEQTAAEANVTKVLRKWVQDKEATNDVSSGSDAPHFPIPPPAPRPFRAFLPSVAPGILGLVRCETFVRLLRNLLDVMLTHGTSSVWWSDNLLDLILHLICVALYEDELEWSKSGSFPFLEAVARVPCEAESEEELDILARNRHWLQAPVNSRSSANLDFLEDSCLTSRLVKVLRSARHEDHAELIEWTLNRWKKVCKLRGPSCSSTEGAESVMESRTTELDSRLNLSDTLSSSALSKQHRAEKARQRRAKIMARMSNMQRTFMSSYATPQEEPKKSEPMDVDEDEDSALPSTSTQPVLPTVPETLVTVNVHAALGPNRSLSELISLLSLDSAERKQKVTCNLCLAKVPEEASSRMVIAAHVCRSSVLSSQTTGWIEGPGTMAVVQRLSASAEEDVKSRKESSFRASLISNRSLDSFLASLATTSAAASTDTAELDLQWLPEFLSNLRPNETSDSTLDGTEEACSAADIAPFTELLRKAADSCSQGKRTLDPWRPRPLVASRDPVAEEGSFVSCCSHPMHAACKVKYARQLKARVDHVNRHRTNSMFVFDFRCPLCKSISTLDIPVLGPLLSVVPPAWLKSQLMTCCPSPSVVDGDVAVRPQFHPLGFWLVSVRQWLESSSHWSASNVTGNSRVEDSSAMSQLEHWNRFNFFGFRHLLSRGCAASTDDNATDVVVRYLDPILQRLSRSLLIHDESKPKPSESSSPSGGERGHEEGSETATRTGRRSFWRSRRFSRGTSNNQDNTSSSTAIGRTNSSPSGSGQSSSTPYDALDNLLPRPPEPPAVTTSLFTMVQRLADLSQPKSVGSLVQRTPGRRTAAEIIVSYGPTVPVPADDEEEVDYQPALTFEMGEDIQIELYPTATITATGNTTTSTFVNVPEGSASFANTSHWHSSSTGEEVACLSLSEEIDRLAMVLRSFRNRLQTLESILRAPAVTDTSNTSHPSGNVDQASLAGGSSDAPTARHSRLPSTQYALVRASLDAAFKQAPLTIQAAAREWRALRHTVAYTLVTSERSIRRVNPREHFFNGGLAERHLIGLRNLLRASLTAHSRHAVVSRGCPLSCGGLGTINEYEATDHGFCWPQQRDQPEMWWWWAYCAPINHSFPYYSKDACRLDVPPNILSVAELSVRVAVTEDARCLWHLLVPQLNSAAFTSPSGLSLSTPATRECMQINSNVETLTGHSDSALDSSGPVSRTQRSISLLWEVDITFLFISLLHLRPGVEEGKGVLACQCRREVAELSRAMTLETGAGSLGPSLLACDEGRPRHPIGDAHEAHLVRLCYVALLVQALLAWDPKTHVPAASELHQLLGSVSDLNQGSSRLTGWMSPQLLQVWSRLRDLAGLPSGDLLSSGPGESEALVCALSLHLRSSCLPFLRIAAFVMYVITGIEPPAELRETKTEDPTASSADRSDEYTLLLAYLGLPAGPSDLLVVLFTPPDEQSQKEDDSTVLKSSTAARSDRSQSCDDISSLSESLWLTRLITSWCLAGRNALSRKLYRLLRARYGDNNETLVSSTLRATDFPLLPNPNIRLPSLIQLPREYTALLSLTTDFNCHAGGHVHSDPSICLVCGHLACLVCYGCRQLEHLSEPAGMSSSTSSSAASSSNPRREFAVYGMQAHSRRCHGGYSILLRIYACRVLLLSDQARRLTELTAPYRDSFGETDPELRRGNPLFLVDTEYDRLNQLWLSHQLAASTTSELLTPPTMEPGLF